MRGLLERAGRALSIAVVVYLLLWLASILWFWLSMPFTGGGIFGYTLIVYYLTLPGVAGLIASPAFFPWPCMSRRASMM